MELFNCRLCGGDLKIDSGDTYKCSCCGSVFVKKAEEDFGEKLKGVLGEEKFARVSATRQNLWSAMHEEYVNSSSCLEYARELKSLVPSDYYANFAETANGKDDRAVSDFLNKSSKEDMETYADAVLDFMIKSMTPGNLTAVCNYIDRAFEKSSKEYSLYIEEYEKEAEKVLSGIYELNLTRDVFLVYSSSDMPRVIELCDFLEGQGISCFMAMRNLRHGKGAADNYDKALKTAMDNCGTIVFVSSKNSRALSCDAMRRELPYLRKTDKDNAPAKYRNVTYDKLPVRYMKPRVEYLIDDYTGTAADGIVKEIFHGLEWSKTKEDVALRVVRYLSSTPEELYGEEDEPVKAAPKAADASGDITKTENVLKHVSQLLKIKDFDGAEELLSKLEGDEIARFGTCSAKVYHYKIWTENKVISDEELVDKLINTDTDLSSDRNFLLACSDMTDTDAQKVYSVQEEIKKLRKEKKEKVAKAKKEKEDKNRAKIKEEGERFSDRCVIADGVLIKYTGKTDTSVVIPPEVVKIGKGAFKGCKTLKSVIIHLGVVAIDDFAFAGCRELTDVFTPETQIRGIGRCAFKGCQSLKSFNIPYGVEEIREGTFDGCKSMKAVSIPCSVKYIRKAAFRGCLRLTDMEIPNSVRLIGTSAFYGCMSLWRVYIPASVESIYNKAFQRCTSLKTLDISNGLQFIGNQTFANCSSLTTVHIPISVTKIIGGAFSMCPIKTVYCDAPTKPHGWQMDWMYGQPNIVWGFDPRAMIKYKEN